MILTVDEILEATCGSLWLGKPGAVFEGASIDSREIKGKELFFPLKGEKEDGHKYIIAALKRGAAGSLLEKKQVSFFSREQFPPGKCVILVNDSQQSLQKIASYYRQKFNIPLLAVTGSNGKTTTKDFLASVLSSRYHVLKTEGNLNNHIGLPLMLLRLRKEHELAVLELGMSSLGEISLLTALSRPSLGVITNIGEAHMEFLGSQENIARAKEELLLMMGSQAAAFLNGDDPFLLRLGKNFRGRTYYFGFNENNDYRVLRHALSREGTDFDVHLPGNKVENFKISLPGKLNIYNALAAIAVGLQLHLKPQQIREGLSRTKFSGMRMEKIWVKSGFYIINDAYNASPSSMKFALQTLQELAGTAKKIAVLGDMLELGPLEAKGHLEIGKYLSDKIDCLVTVGKRAVLIAEGAKKAGFPSQNIFSVKNQTEAVKYLEKHPLPDAFILVKGSRGMYMETVVEELLAKYN
jgi:UDP-N-acetylmuramoyl-tripeptide--D-alanyl-D-alanine ligase